MPAILGDSTWAVLPSEIYGAKVPLPAKLQNTGPLFKEAITQVARQLEPPSRRATKLYTFLVL